MDRKDFQDLSRIRLKEAALLAIGMHDGAYYLAGYAVECALKACIAKATKRFQFPDKKRVDSSHSHSLRDLVNVAGLEQSLLDLGKSDGEFADNWNVAKGWTELSRYRRNDKQAAYRLVSAVAEKKHRVIKWIMRYW